MKIEAAVPAIAEAAAFAARHSPRVPAIPAMAGMVLQADVSGQVTFTGYDVEASSTMTVPALISEPGLALLPGRPVAEILRTLPPGETMIAIEDTTVRITAGEIEFVLPIMEADDRARLADPPAATGHVAGADLKQAIGQVASVTGRDVVPPILTAVRIDLGPQDVRLAATDKYRIALRSLRWEADGAAARALVPAHQLAATAAALDPTRDWSLGVDGAHLAVRDGLRTCMLRLIDGAYPPIESVVPESFASMVQIDRIALLQAIRRVSLAVEERNRGAIVLTSSDSDSAEVTGGSGTSRGRQRLACRHTGQEVGAAFTATYLIAALESLPSEWASIRLNPGIGKVLIGAPDVADYQHVVMSRRLPGQ